MPFDELKIGRAFTQGAAHDKHKHVIVDASVILSQEFSLQLVAEGIENHEDWVFSKKAECNIIQGNFLSRPIPADEMILWIDNYWKSSGRV